MIQVSICISGWNLKNKGRGEINLNKIGESILAIQMNMLKKMPTSEWPLANS